MFCLQANLCQFIAVVFGCKIGIKGKHALKYFLSKEKSHGSIKLTYKTRLLSPDRLIVENVFFTVLPKIHNNALARVR